MTIIQARPKWNTRAILEAMTNGAELVSELAFGGGWFILKPGEERCERTRIGSHIIGRLMAKGYIATNGPPGSLTRYGLSALGREQHERYLGVKSS